VVHRLLIVEDDSANLQVLWKTLEQGGFVMDAATTADDALALARTTQYSAILVDVGLPGLDGLELCRRLRQDPRGTALPIVVTSAYAAPEEIAQAERAGATQYLTKPLDFSALPGLLRELIETTGH